MGPSRAVGAGHVYTRPKVGAAVEHMHTSGAIVLKDREITFSLPPDVPVIDWGNICLLSLSAIMGLRGRAPFLLYYFCL